MSGEETKFSVLCSLFGWIQKSKSTSKKRSKFRKFLDSFCIHGDYFPPIRLILPSLDRDRGSYGLKHSALSLSLIDALGISKDSHHALRLLNWRKGGSEIGANAGNFALVAADLLQTRQPMVSPGLTIKDLNHFLDRLASSEKREDKVLILSALLNKTNSLEMKWILMIILKDLKLGITEKSILLEFHPDAEHLFNVTCDLRLVCETLVDRSRRSQRQDIEIGRAVRPQLAARVSDGATAWKKLQGKEIVVECKFDGDRIQMHKNGRDLHFFSRNFIDHCEYNMPGISEIISQNISVDRCIMDGEMLVWDNTVNRFADFGSNQEVAKGADRERHLCYVAFDVLYVGDSSVIHRSLKERHEILKQIVNPLKGHLEIVVPNYGGSSSTSLTSTEPCRSLIARSVDDVHRFFMETVENRDEGIILKDLSSKWEPGDRSGKWLKLKPDYVRSGSDLDVLIIGGYYGSGRRGGEVTQFLVGLAEREASNIHPRKFVSFCRVGSGLSDEELDSVVTRLRPFFRKYDYPKKTHPNCYRVTNHSKERPDVWVENPENSVILSITSDIRTTSSDAFAAPYCLRFPRIDRVRLDKQWHECLDVVDFVDLVHSNNGTTRKLEEHMGLLGGRKPGQSDTISKKKQKPRVCVPSHLVRADVSDIKSETQMFSNMLFYFVNVPSNHSPDFFHKMVVENGGAFSTNLNNSVTHCIASESRGGIKYKAAKLNGDIIHYSWLLDCFSRKRLVQLQPKYYIFFSAASKRRLHDEVDEFSDSYYVDIDISEIKQIFSGMDRNEDPKMIEYYRAKFCPNDEWVCFVGCCIYFYTPMVNGGPDSEVILQLSVERMKLEVCRGGGRTCESILDSTHFVVFPAAGSDINFEAILSGLPDSDRSILCGGKIHVVGSQWVELSLERNDKLEEDSFSLIPKGFGLSTIDQITPILVQQASNISSDEEDSSETSKRKRERTPNDSGKQQSDFEGIQKGFGRPNQNVSETCLMSNYDELSKLKENTDNEEDDEGCFCENLDFYKEGLRNPSSRPNIDNGGPHSIPDDEPIVDDKGGDSCHHVSTDTLDPIQAMLLDMIPSLGGRNSETGPNIGPADELSLSPKGEPGKKRRVSYKDTVRNMFDDW